MVTLPHVTLAEIGLGLAIGMAAVIASAYVFDREPSAGRSPRPHAGQSQAGGRSRALALSRAGSGLGMGGRRTAGARWALRHDIASLLVRARPRRAGGRLASVPAGRIVLGTLACPRGGAGRLLLACEPAQSVAVVGPTQCGKTTAVAVPAILRWEGPVVAASVKTDLVRDTLEWRRGRGTVWCFDPAGTTGLPSTPWSPLPGSRTWAGARRTAADLTEVAQGPGTTADGEFWYAAAAKLLAPLLYAASIAQLTMHDVVRWVDTQEMVEVADILAATGTPEALQSARATWQREERQRSSVYTTVETVLEPFAEPFAEVVVPVPVPVPVPSSRTWGGPPQRSRGDRIDQTPPYGIPAVGASKPALRGEIDPNALLDGSNTLYLCAPAHDQRRLRALFTALVKQVVETAFTRSSVRGAPLTPPLLVVLDEAANIAPLPDLDGLAATCAGHGVQLMSVWQDLAQIAARYGERSGTVVNNHRATLYLSGTSDPRTLDHVSHLVGDEVRQVPSVSRDHAGRRTVTTSATRRPLLPPDALRQMQPGTGVLVYGALPPVLVALRPWFRDPELSRRGGRHLSDAGSTLTGSTRVSRAPSGSRGVGRSARSARRRGSARR